MSIIFDNPQLAMLALILGFGFLIFVHELGHFLVAKWAGIRATQFAIGFGNAIVSYRKGLGLRVGGTEREYSTKAIEALQAEGVSLEGLTEHKRNQLIMEKADSMGLSETEYRLNWIPLGGYVKMLGQEDMDPSAQSDDPRSFNKKSIGARAAVISAGVIMNLIFALIFFVVCFQIGVKFPAAVVGGTESGSPADVTYADGYDGNPAYQGLQPGDKITHINGKPITDMAEVRIATALGKGGQAVAMTVEREGEAQPLLYNITALPSEANEGLLSAGIRPANTLVVGESPDPKRKGQAAVVRGDAFDQAGVEANMKLVAVNGQAIENHGQFIRAFQNLDAPQVDMKFVSPDGGKTIDVATVAGFQPLVTAIDENTDFLNVLGLRPGTLISSVSDGDPADDAGVLSGDVVAKLGSTSWPAIESISDIVKAEDARDGLDLAVWRGGERVQLGQVTPSRGLIGVGLNIASATNVVAAVVPGSPFDQASGDRPLPAGSKLVQVGSTPISNWSEFQHAVLQSMPSSQDPENQAAATPVEATLTLTFEVNLGEETTTEQYQVSLTDEAIRAQQAQHAWLPPSGLSFEPLMTTVKADGPIEATQIGIEKTGQFIQQTYITLLRLFQGSIGVKNLRGPVGIVDEGSKVAKQGMAYYLFFLGLISVNLAVLNFLPLPIVDGGLMVFLLIEKIKGSPASPQVQTAVALVGLVGLACVFLYVTFNDISRIVAG